MARILKHFLITAPFKGLTFSFERVETAADSFQVRESESIKQRITWEARNDDGELVYHGQFYRCYDRTKPGNANMRIGYEVELYRKRSDGNMMLVNEFRLTEMREFIISIGKSIIGAWAHMDRPNYVDQKNLVINTDTGLLVSATPAADATRAQSDNDVEPQTVEIGMNWKLAMPILIMVLENGTSEGKASAKAELMRLANAIDELNVKGSN